MTRSRDIADQQKNAGGAVAPFVAGRNKIINGDFFTWQRGTSFSLGNGTTYTADRWRTYRDGSGATCTLTRETFTPGTAPVVGYEGTYFLRYNQSVAGTGATYSALGQPIEDVRTFAGQIITVSFWAKSNASRNINIGILQDYAALTTSWQRFSFKFNITATTGKTIGTNSYLQIYFDMPLNQTYVLDVWGFQAEAGNVATPFTTASGSIGGELALCQRYYYRLQNGATIAHVGVGAFYSTTAAYPQHAFPVVMRTAPSMSASSQTGGIMYYNNLSQTTNSCASAGAMSARQAEVLFGFASAATIGWGGACYMQSNQYIEFSAEL